MKAKKDRKGFFKEFKEFISRGNVLDLAVGVIIGGAFSAIVTALSEHILKPIINWILAKMIGADALDSVYTFLIDNRSVDPVTGAVDLSTSIYIDWGSFINAIINFLLIALVLFLIIKAINSVQNAAKKAKEEMEARRAKGETAEEVASEAVEEAPAPEPVPAAPTTDELLTEIRDLLKAQSETKAKKAKKEE